MRNLYTEDEVVICTYIARFGRKEFDENDIINITNRSLNSIKMKVQNIAAMLDETGIETSNQVSKLTGLPAGQTGRRTNWDVVVKLINLSENELRKKCIEILTNE